MTNTHSDLDQQFPAPRDGRFGSGPSKVRSQQLAAIQSPPMGTSHRQAGVRDVVGSIQAGLAELFRLPDGYEVLLGNGGASALWDAITFALIEDRAQAAVIGEFSGKAARAVERAPWLADPDMRRVEPGQVIECATVPGIDTYIYAHNETSTGAAVPLVRYGDDGALTVVDGTSIAGGVNADVSAADFYYFSPQKCFGADGGLWLAFASPAALERIERLAAERWIPDFLNLQLAVNNSRKSQTLNTPAIATLLMLDNQVSWMLDSGGLDAMEARSRASSDAVYQLAEQREFASPFIAPEFRSPVVCTIDFTDDVDAAGIAKALRARGIVDIEPYRSLGRNQLRIATFPAIDTEDVRALLAAIDHVIAAR
ncbi:phosphoserine transaminase [Trueperella bialowiezensis]|uniref:phosphoserine transaminase n=1 Tax=Trueperella bialowiezensis TaxID=312285 RepID=A0A3S4VFN6_9ACTO|nr:phosphoserine transaminase [Trueperella bialowiezensis]VEI13089.1 Putative phosphoserine aminotransferase [Trueperella bialowiezensis]